jgi:hypothetical protein
MNEQEGVIRISISVPRKLKAEMEAVAGTTNWSAVACEAFRAHLLGLAARRRDVETRGEVIARWKAIDELEASDDYQAGRAAGERWARQEARPGQLRNLVPMRNLKEAMDEADRTLPKDPDGPFATVAREAARWGLPPVGWHVYFGMLGRRRAVTTHEEVRSIAAQADEFWLEVLGDERDRIDSANFGQGLVEGALGVWEEFQDSMEAAR